MPKSRKQNTGVKKKTSPGEKTNKPVGRTLKSAAIDDSVSAAFSVLEPPTAGRKNKRQPTLGKSVPRLEMQLGGNTDVSEERASIISIVRGLEEQVDTAFKLKEVLEVELDAIQKKLSEETAARAQLETEVGALEAQTALAEQLREDISFTEQERNKLANSLAELQPQFKAVTEERNSLAKQLGSAEAQVKKLKDEKMAIEGQVMNLKEKLADMNRLRTELDEVTKVRRHLDEQVQDLCGRLEDSDTSKNTLEKELGRLNKQVESLQEKLAASDSRTADLRFQLEEQQAANKELVDTRTRLESEIKMLSINHEAARSELEAFKKALREVRSEASRTSGRVRQRYFKPKNKKK